jgi:hypothetical protein
LIHPRSKDYISTWTPWTLKALKDGWDDGGGITSTIRITDSSLARQDTLQQSFSSRLQYTIMSTENPVVFFDISIGGSPKGRIEMELRADVVPKTAEVSVCLVSTLRIGWSLCLGFFSHWVSSRMTDSFLL